MVNGGTSRTDEIFAQLKAAKEYDPVATMPEDLVVGSDTAFWLDSEQIGNPSRIGLLPDCPARTMAFVLQEIPPGGSTDMQRHPHESVHCVVEGEGYSEIGGRTVQWRDGDFIYTPPWVWHRHYGGTRTTKIILVENSPVLELFGVSQRDSAGLISYEELP